MKKDGRIPPILTCGYTAQASTVDIPSGSLSINPEGVVNILRNSSKGSKDTSTLASKDRKSERLKQEKPVLDAFWAWVDSVRDKVLPKSKLGEALTYATNYKKELMNYLENGNCSISNNLAENSIRPFTIGRKNWLFSGSPKGAAASAAVYTIIETAKANGLNPYKYLYFIFKDMPGVQFGRHPEFLEDYLPWSPDAQERCR